MLPTYAEALKNKEQYILPPMSIAPTETFPTPVDNTYKQSKERPVSQTQSEHSNASTPEVTDDEEVILLRKLNTLQNKYMLALNPGHPQLSSVNQNITVIRERLAEIGKDKLGPQKQLRRVITEQI